MGMKKPLPPAVSTSHVVSSAGTGVGTRRVSAPAGSPSDLYPLVGRDVLLGYGSLSAAAALTTAAATVVGSGGNKTMITEAVGPPKLRPMSSMENVEFAWSPASLAIPACPTTTTTMAEADGRAVVSAASFTGVDATTTPAMSLDRHSSNPNKFSCPAGSGSHSSSDFIPANINNRRNRNESSNSTTSRSSIFQHRQNSDQDSRGGLSKPLPPVVAVGRVSLDQQSIHPLQMDPDLDTATEENTDAVAEAMEGRVTTMLTRDDDVGQGTSTTTTPTTTLPISDQVCESSSLSTPVSMGLANLSSSLNAAPAGLASGAHHSLVPVSSQQQPKEQEQQQQLQPQQVIRKKTSFAAKLRKVFNNSKSLPPTPQDHTPAHSSHAASMTNTAVTSTVSQQEQTQEDIISLVSGDDLYGSYGTRAATHADMVAFMDQQQQHRGSVSSASSADTDVQQHPRHHLHHHVNSTFRRGSSQSQSQTDTPSTSPEATPCGSPTDQSTLKAVMTEAPAAFATTPAAASVSESSLPTGPNDTNSEAHHHHHQHRLHPLSGSESSSSPSAQDVESTSSSTPATGTAHVVLPTNQTAADVASALQQPPSKTNPTRTVKKRLSFASISSFFSPRNGSNSGNSVTSQQEARAKQQRASSVPHVENPLVTVGRQIAGFQRRHSLNDLHDNKTATAAATNTATGISRVGVSPLEKDPKALPPTPGHGSSVSAGATTSSNPPVSSHIPTPPKPTKKLSLNIVFNKGLRKKKNSTTASKPESPLPAKPLRSALANRNNGNNLPGQTTTAQSPPKVHLVHRSASRRRSASIRSQGSAHRRHHRNSHHSSHYHHHHHHHHNAHQQTDPFARLAEANHALANLNRRSSQDQAALRHLQQHQIQEGGFSDEFEFCTSPSSMEAPAGGLPIPLDTQDLHFHHNNQSREDLPISPTGPGTDELNGSTSAMDTGSKLSDGTSQIRHDAHPITFNRSQYPQQRNPLSTLSPSSSCCSYLSSSSSDRVEGSSFRSASNDVESCSSSSRSSKQDPVSPETTATAAISTIGSAIDSSSSRRGSADHEPTTVFNPLLPASAARVSVNRIAMESQQKARSDNNASDTSSSDGSASGRGSSNGSRYGGGGSQGGMSNDSETLYDHYASTGSAAPSAAAVATAAALSLTLSAESASTMSNSSTEASSTTSSTASANSPTKKNLTIMNTVTEDVSEEESMMHAQLAYIQQQQQQYLVQQQQPYQHQQQQEHHQHHHHVHYLPHNPHQHLPSSHYHPSQNQPHSDNEPIPSQPHHHQPYYYPHPSHFPPRPPRQLQFSTKEPLIFPTWTPEQYDRTSDAYITASRLTPAMANKIKLELNQFKSQEMLVHEESRVYTHFFI
ncbi:bud neck involved protein [Linnemannia zychae]|nr:bud neck involved protein [Linnemannia zychae]